MDYRAYCLYHHHHLQHPTLLHHPIPNLTPTSPSLLPPPPPTTPNTPPPYTQLNTLQAPLTTASTNHYFLQQHTTNTPSLHPTQHPDLYTPTLHMLSLSTPVPLNPILYCDNSTSKI
ncbi:hypothetical protein Pmani_010765 [Petrolisthes manimaculis]|uniref:Uncharacterized protein n=1 Tax=Petrolisthes manimaculis TaxID=1843537 RepID=A0AAE1UBP5_9EUCA|nr:hypothetical protein Pmani_010765 [Petrolisthes manimaculis]